MTGQKIFNFEGWIGGTELMALNLEEKVFPLFPKLKDWNWIIAPGKIDIKPDGKNIAWIHLGEFEGDMSWICNPLVAHVIFVSYYQYQRFVEMYPYLDTSKCHVLKNAIDPINIKLKNDSKIRLIFHSEPYRGLDLLLKAFKNINDDDIELHVFGDLNTNTIDWKIEFQQKIKDMCQEDKRIITHGRVTNSQIRDFIGSCDMFAYPSTWRETSCISLIEAMSAGLYCITNSFTVLPETSMGYAKIYPFNKNPEKETELITKMITDGISEIRSGKFNPDLQIKHTNENYSWDSRVKDWEKFCNILMGI